MGEAAIDHSPVPLPVDADGGQGLAAGGDGDAHIPPRFRDHLHPGHGVADEDPLGPGRAGGGEGGGQDRGGQDRQGGVGHAGLPRT